MAEFQEVMKQLNRLCSHYQRSHYQNCIGCPIFDDCGSIGTHCSDPKHSYKIEKTVMSWSVENPEPVYPTWAEWLQSQRILDDYHGGNACLNISALRSIPADIAEKLGIEPKEGI